MPLHLPSLFAFFRLNDLWPVAAPCVIGAAAVFLLLPRPEGGRTALLGTLLGGLTLVLAAFLLVKTKVLSPETVLFYTFSALAIIGGVVLVTQRNPARAALSFALVVLSMCGLFLLLAAPFLMAATIIIYAGAIIVTFLFVLMLASQAGITDADARTREPLLATALGFLLLGCLIYVLQVSYESNEPARELDKLIARTETARTQVSAANLAEYQSFRKDLENDLEKVINKGADTRPASQTKELQDLRETVRAAFQRSEWPDKAETASLDDVKKGIASLERGLMRVREQYGWLPPLTDGRPRSSPKAGIHNGTASDLSGPSAIEPAAEWRYDGEQRPYLPADNSAYLGRSLFTDFLLPVELGGVLLLVATIGAIAIAQRRTTPEGPMTGVALHHYLVVGAVLFCLGLIGFLTRRNLIIMFLCAEMMLQGVAINLVAFARFRGNLQGQAFTLFIITVAACEAAIALALILMLFKRRGSLDVSLWQELREAGQEESVDDEPLPAPPPSTPDPVLTPSGLEPEHARHETTHV